MSATIDDMINDPEGRALVEGILDRKQAGPYAIAKLYAAGGIDRDTMIRELSTWPYAKNEGADAAASEWDSTPYLDTPGSFAEVGKAFDEGLIDGEAYDEILSAAEKPCPTDHKRAYVSEKAAQDSYKTIRELGPSREGMKPYECICGMWHLGHP